MSAAPVCLAGSHPETPANRGVRASRPPVSGERPPARRRIILEEVQNEKRQQAPPAGRCKATNKRGEPCRATIVGADGLCPAHNGRDMRELGAKGGRARRKGVAEQLPAGERESLRQHLRDTLDHETIKAAIERALAGGNESARVAAVKFLADLELYRKDGGKDDWERERAIVTAEAAERFNRLIQQRAAAHEQRQVRDALGELAAELRREAVEEHPDLTNVVVDEMQAQEILEALEEVGLVVRRGTLEEMAEEMAQERLAALKAEHGIPHP